LGSYVSREEQLREAGEVSVSDPLCETVDPLGEELHEDPPSASLAQEISEARDREAWLPALAWSGVAGARASYQG